MKKMKVDLAVIGGGPAGMAAALEAKRQGVEKVIIIERDKKLGGILQQCIHDGFGIQRFGERLAGTEYAQRFIDQIKESDIEVLLETMVIEMTPEKEIYACSGKHGMVYLTCGAIVAAMGGTFADTCFRFREYGKWLMREGEDVITPEDLALILMDERGSHKGVQGLYYRVVLNQADGEKELKAAEMILKLLPVTMQKGCAVTAYRK